MSDLKQKNPGKKYNNDFKKTIVAARELSSEYGVSEVTIYKWIKEPTSVGEEVGLPTPKEVAAIQKENLRLKQELEILKKAMAIFTKK